jgi:SAM-dependent methyltransferase
MKVYQHWDEVFNERASCFENPLDICDYYSSTGHHTEEWFTGICNYIANSLSLTTQDRVLEVGCGCGVLCSRLIARVREYVGIDRAERVIAKARELHTGPTFQVAAADALPCPDAAFDKAFAHAFLFYLPDYETAERVVREMGRVVKPGGRVLVGHVPNAHKQAEYNVLRQARGPRPTHVEHNLRWLWFTPEFFDRFRKDFAALEVDQSERSFDPASRFRFDVHLIV